MTGETLPEQSISEPLQPMMVRTIAKLVSYVAHPLFVPLYVTFFLLYVHPLLFAGYQPGAKLRLMGTVFVNLSLLPAVTVFLCRRLGFVDTIFMNTQKERIIPLAAAMIFYFWCWFVLRNFTEIPELFRQFLLGTFITIIMAWMANIYFKISLHALAMGGLFSFMLLVVYTFEGGSAAYVLVAALVAGLVCTARLLLGVHRPFEVYAGFVLGGLSQVLAVWLN